MFLHMVCQVVTSSKCKMAVNTSIWAVWRMGLEVSSHSILSGVSLGTYITRKCGRSLQVCPFVSDKFVLSGIGF